jgi:hypothetical protein
MSISITFLAAVHHVMLKVVVSFVLIMTYIMMAQISIMFGV